MPRYTIHPWRSQLDLLAVRDQLYDKQHPKRQRHAVTRILSCWKLRGNLPHAVESTALLVDAQLHHSHNPDISQFAVRAVYAAAFTRFVTGFCDIGRARENSLQPSSMLDVAKRIGMPVDFVALRHEATHEEMPSLPRLVEAVARGVAWLDEVYWSKLGEGFGKGSATVGAEKGVEGRSTEAVKTEARRLLKAFRSGRREAFRARRQGRAEHGAEISAAAQACHDLCAPDGSGLVKEGNVEALAEVLVDERFIFPSSRSLGESMDGAFTLWDPLLRSIAYLDRRLFISTLVKRLQAQLSSPTNQSSQDTQCEAAALWLLHVHDYAVQTPEYLQLGTLRVCCLYPGHWTRIVGLKLLERDEELMEEWGPMFEASMLAEGGGGMDVNAAPGDAALDTTSRTLAMDSPDDTGGFSRGWRRAPLSPRVPIGVVG